MAIGLNHERGFTLVELMLATLIFSMVIAGLAAIYSTAFSQSGAVLRDARLKSSAMIAYKDMTQRLVGATRLDSPAATGSGSVLRGCANMAPDGVQNTTAIGFSSFGFCVQPGAVGACGSGTSPAPCLFSYNWTNVCPAPALTNANCGTAVSGVPPEMLASRVLVPAAYADYFVRTGNAVRMSFTFRRDATGKIPTMNYEVSTVGHGQFDTRL